MFDYKDKLTHAKKEECITLIRNIDSLTLQWAQLQFFIISANAQTDQSLLNAVRMQLVQTRKFKTNDNNSFRGGRGVRGKGCWNNNFRFQRSQAGDQ